MCIIYFLKNKICGQSSDVFVYGHLLYYVQCSYVCDIFAVRWWIINHVYLSSTVVCIGLFIESHLSYFVMPLTLLITYLVEISRC